MSAYKFQMSYKLRKLRNFGYDIIQKQKIFKREKILNHKIYFTKILLFNKIKY